jgi:long-chain acyl-CoA synthetase
LRAFEHFQSLTAMFFARAAERDERPFLWSKQGDAWQSISWAEAARRVAALARALTELGVQPGDHDGGRDHRADLHHEHDARPRAYHRQ